MRKFTGYGMLAACCMASVMYTACGDDSSSSATNTDPVALPDTVASYSALVAQYTCGNSLKCKGTYLMDMGYGVCDGEGGWTFGSLIHEMGCGIDYVPGYDEPPVSSSSLVDDEDVSSSSKTDDPDSSDDEGDDESSSSAEESSSSGIKFEQKIVCSAAAGAGACDAMDKNDVSTWHFVGKDDFGRPVEYTYAADGRDLIVTIKDADGTNSKTYSMYNMTSEVGVEMAFSAAKSTCVSVGGNEVVADDAEQTCDTLLVPVIEYGKLTDSRDNNEYKTVTIGKQVWMAENLRFDEFATVVEDEYFYSWVVAIGGPLLNDTLYCNYEDQCNIDMTIQGVCPDGWRLPSKADFDSLLENVGKEAVTFLSVEAGGKDLVGLSVNLVGYFNGYDRKMQSVGENINFWAADNSNWRSSGYATSLEITDDDVSIDEFPKDWGASVRCVKDVE